LGNAAPNDGEYARMLAIMDELEKQELAAESGNHSDENDETTGDFDKMSYQGYIDNNLSNSKVILLLLFLFVLEILLRGF